MATYGIGKGQANGWDEFSTQTNVNTQGIGGTTNPTDETGYATLNHQAANVTENWADLIGWSENNDGAGDCTSDGTNLRIYSPDTTDSAFIYDVDWNAVGDPWSVYFRFKFPVTPWTSTVLNAAYGPLIYYDDGTDGCAINIRSDGTYFDIYVDAGGNNWTKYDTLIPVDTNWHTGKIALSGTGNDLHIWFDDILVTKVGATSPIYGTDGRLTMGTPATVGAPYDWLHYETYGYGSNASYNTSQGILGGAIKDFGAGKQASTLTWDDITDDSTSVVYKVRCAATEGGLAGESFETIASSGDSIVSKGRWVEIRVELDDASAGLFAPLIKNLYVTDEAAGQPGMNLNTDYWG